MIGIIKNVILILCWDANDDVKSRKWGRERGEKRALIIKTLDLLLFAFVFE